MAGLNETMEIRIQKHDLDVISMYVNYIHAVNLGSLSSFLKIFFIKGTIEV